MDAVLESTNLEPYSAVKKAAVLESAAAKPEFKETAEALARVISISKKSETSAIDASLFENPQEEELFKAYEACRQQIETLYKQKIMRAPSVSCPS